MQKSYIFLIFLFLINNQIFASFEDDPKEIGKIKIIALDTSESYSFEYFLPEEDVNEIFEEKLNNLTDSWISNIFVPDSIEINNIETIGLLPDSTYIERLKKIDTPIQLSYNKIVKNYLSLYTIERREQVERMLGLSAFYFPIFEEILDKYGLPLELKYLPVIESALNPNARSRAGATGLWQFIYSTGKMMKLDITSYVDERRDVLKSTEAAAQYLKQLYDIYGDWQLVIAAYNCGPGNVNKAIRRSGGSKNYWEIYYRLPRETRGYVPAFIAATYIMNYYQDHYLSPQIPLFSIQTDTIMVNDYLNLNQVSEYMNIDLIQLRELNPMYTRDIIPARPEKTYPLRIPSEYIGGFIDKENRIYSYKRESYFPDNTLVEPAAIGTVSFVPASIEGKEIVYYEIKTGDNLGYIAEWYDVRASDLRYWNNINGNLIRAGQKLGIYVPEEKIEYYSSLNDQSFEQKQALEGNSSTNSSVTSIITQELDPDYEYYTVQSGDNLWTIAQKYPGISNTDIQNLNNITNTRGLYPGQKLKIRKKV